jgi:hypothetical protein
MRAVGFAFDVELIARCVQLGASVTEIAVTWRDVPGSTFSVQRHGASALREIASIWLDIKFRCSAAHTVSPVHHHLHIPLPRSGDCAGALPGRALEPGPVAVASQ